jgi:hypothetical protein
MPPVAVQEVGKGLSWRQFIDLPLVFAAEAAEAPGARWLLTVQRKRLTANRYPGECAYFLARRGSDPIGRITAHFLPGATEGSFGFFAVERPSDVDATRALVEAAAGWLGERGCQGMSGPLSWTPTWYGGLLAGAGLDAAEEAQSYRLAAGPGPGVIALSRAELSVPDSLAPYADPALLLRSDDGHGAVVAVPDVATAFGEGTARRAWALAKRARTRSWDTCVVLALEGDPALVIPSLCAAAGRAGYSWVVSPWAPTGNIPRAAW